jgi:hypothetical protein
MKKYFIFGKLKKLILNYIFLESSFLVDLLWKFACHLLSEKVPCCAISIFETDFILFSEDSLQKKFFFNFVKDLITPYFLLASPSLFDDLKSISLLIDEILMFLNFFCLRVIFSLPLAFF